MSEFHFLRPSWLLASLPAFSLWWTLHYRSDTTRLWHGVIDPGLLRHFIVGGTGRGRLGPGDMLLAGWVIAILAIAGPAWQLEPPLLAADAPPLMLILRVSPSMQNSDLPPSRLARATQKIADLLRLNAGEPVGLIAYAGSAHLVLPPTRDAAVVQAMAGALSPGIMPKKGDTLAEAVALARRLLADGRQGGSILVLADQTERDQAARLRGLPSGAPVSVLAMLRSDQTPGSGLHDAAAALNADLTIASISDSDVAGIAQRAARSTTGTTQSGEATRWRDDGWLLVPVLTAIVLLWFRRGWTMVS